MTTMPPSALALARPPLPADAVSPPPPFSAATRLAARPMRCRLFLPLPSLFPPPAAVIATAVVVPSGLAVYSTITVPAVIVVIAVVLVVLPVLFLDGLALGPFLFDNADIAVAVDILGNFDDAMDPASVPSLLAVADADVSSLASSLAVCEAVSQCFRHRLHSSSSRWRVLAPDRRRSRRRCSGYRRRRHRGRCHRRRCRLRHCHYHRRRQLAVLQSTLRCRSRPKFRAPVQQPSRAWD